MTPSVKTPPPEETTTRETRLSQASSRDHDQSVPPLAGEITNEAARSNAPDTRHDARRPTSTARAASVRRWLSRLTILALLLLPVSAAIIYRSSILDYLSGWRGDEMPAPITAVARKTVVPHVVLAGGELQSADSVEVVCEVEGQNSKIVEMVPEGTQVKEGQVVVRLDPSEINDRLAQQKITVTQVDATAKAAQEELKIQKNLAESAIAEAKLTVKIAELDRKKYIEGEYQVELNDLRGSIALAETDLQEAQDLVEHYKMLVRKDFRSPEQLEAKQQAVQRAQFTLNRDKEKLQVLEKFTRERQEVELTAKAEEAVRELERVKSSTTATLTKAETDLEVAEATAALEREQLRRIQEQLTLCEVRAPTDGTLIYAKDKNKKIELGAEVHFKQKLFSLPDLSKMQVAAFIHESEVQQVRRGMTAEIQVEAFPELPLTGTVSDIATFYDPTRQWMSGGVKEYATSVLIDQLPDDVGLKPGMTAQLTIRIGDLSDGVIVPVAAVASREDKSYCFRATGKSLEAVEVTLGDNTEFYVEVLSGLNEGDRVALDARARLDAMQEDEQTQFDQSSDSLLATTAGRGGPM